MRSEMTFGNGQIISAANTSSAWVRGLDGQLRTLTGAEAEAAKLQALLDASHLVDLQEAAMSWREWFRWSERRFRSGLRRRVFHSQWRAACVICSARTASCW